MELTIQQALQEAIQAQNQENFQKAEEFYRAILSSQPEHPEANHNLGLIAIATNNIDAALPLFKRAFEANSKIEQFWISYIDILIKLKQFETALSVTYFPNRRMTGYGVERSSANDNYATLFAQISRGEKNVFDSDFDYTKLQFSYATLASRRFWTLVNHC